MKLETTELKNLLEVFEKTQADELLIQESEFGITAKQVIPVFSLGTGIYTFEDGVYIKYTSLRTIMTNLATSGRKAVILTNNNNQVMVQYV